MICRSAVHKMMGKLLPVVLMSMVLGACSTEPRRLYAQQPGDATVHLHSKNMPMAVGYSLSSSEVPCEGFEYVGSVRDDGKSSLLPWVASLSNALNGVPTERQARVPAGKPVQVKGFSYWSDKYSKGSCGPVARQFVAQPSGVYRVDFVWSGPATCTMRVMDVAVPESPKDVPVQSLNCPRPPGL
ncbi:hypothetical protein AVMA1855_23095 [Acidovorax sp. SUPP1855]|uniref:hypothetical protein n=1 Tax=Acidovorax sp. SUPP1855 TaxID=431774 RepID=UPI0023DE4BFE|nr:hypothetical protein [Acidovorax sp. SUPP1855]GKS87093.1 hypothetical protein AVMA1855_23095 [Acidovorax sp. SUPP1855]